MSGLKTDKLCLAQGSVTDNILREQIWDNPSRKSRNKADIWRRIVGNFWVRREEREK